MKRRYPLLVPTALLMAPAGGQGETAAITLARGASCTAGGHSFGLPLFMLLRYFRLFRLWIVCALGVIAPLALFFDAPFRLARTAP
jgi:hypothetical protein